MDTSGSAQMLRLELACGMQSNLPALATQTATETSVKPTATETVTVFVAIGDLNIRTLPGENYPDIGDVHKGETVYCTGFSVVEDGGIWCEHERGWSNVRWLEEN